MNVSMEALARRLRAGLALALLVLPIAVSLLVLPGSQATFVATFTSQAPAAFQIYYDIGAGSREPDSAIFASPSGKTEIRILLPTAPLYSVRVDPSKSPGVYTIEDARIEARGAIIRRFRPEEFMPVAQIGDLSVRGDALVIQTTPDAFDPSVWVKLDPPLDVRGANHGGVVLGLLAVVLAGLLAMAVPAIVEKPWSWAYARVSKVRPAVLASVVIAAAAIASIYPVVFFGKSLTSPSLGGVVMDYVHPPWSVGATNEQTENVNSSDVGAFGWWFRPISVVESKAMMEDGEASNWNRYTSMGAPMLGQGISMLGDPLQLIPIVAHGAAWAWDLKFVLAKILFAFGVALNAWLVTRRTPVAVLCGVAAAFIGFFSYRINHAAYFALCYEPWILLGWFALSRATTGFWRGAGLVSMSVATVATVCSGAIKEGVVATVLLHLAGAFALVTSPLPWREKQTRLALAVLAGGATVLILWPQIQSFLATLAEANTVYDQAVVIQFPEALAGILFDSLIHGGIPALNFLFGIGMCWAVTRIGTLGRDRALWVMAAVALLSASFVFTIMPAAWIIQMPFISRIYHLYNTFAHPLSILIMIMAAYGFGDMIATASDARWEVYYYRAVGLLLFLVVIAVGYEQTHYGFAERSRLVYAMVCLHVLMALALPWIVRRISVGGVRAQPAAAMALLVVLGGALWREGVHLRTGRTSLDDIILNLGERPDFGARPRIFAQLPDPLRSPFRIMGMNGGLWPGYSAAYGLEGPSGPDGLRSRRYIELIEASGLKLHWDWAMLLDTQTLQSASGFFDMLNVRYLTVEATDPLAATAKFSDPKDALALIERPTAWPRAFFTDTITPYDTPAQITDRTRSEPGHPFAMVARADLAVVPTAAGATGVVVPAQNYLLDSDETSFTVDAPGPGVIVLIENNFKGVYAKVNGRDAPVFFVDHAFRGVAVQQAGRYRVTFGFAPTYARLAPYTLIGGLLLLALTAAAASGVIPRRRSAVIG